MSDSTSVSTPESIEITGRDVWAFAERAWECHAYEANLILLELTNELRSNGLFHGQTLLDIATGYGACASKVLRAGLYLAERKVISIQIDEEVSEDACWCPSCHAHRCFASLPFDTGPDEQGALDEKTKQATPEKQVAHDRDTRGYVYLLQSGGRFKIGITSHIQRRLKQLRSQQPPFPIELVHFVLCPDPRLAERALHERFSEARVHGEWFDLSDEKVRNVIRSMHEWRIDSDAAESQS